MKPNTLSLILFPLFTYFAATLGVKAVIPAPDGCYPNFTTAEGCDALNLLATGEGNTGLGWRSLYSTSTGNFNTGVGAGALVLNNADSNTAVGAAALLLNTTGIQNTAVGTDALVHNDAGFSNTAVGAFALFTNAGPGGTNNTATGTSALASNTTGEANTANGRSALVNSTTGSNNTAIGSGAGGNVVTASDVTCIGVDAGGADVSNTTWIGNVYGVTTINGTTSPVIVSADGQLGTVASSERFKKDIAAMDKASETILSLRPVTFHYKTDSKGIPQFGLIAEEVAKVNPVLVLPDKEGKPYTVRYDAVNAMLLNEFLKEHKTVQKQQEQIDSLKADLKEQKALIQKVSAQLELNKVAPQMVRNTE